MSYLSREQFIETMNLAMDQLRWNTEQTTKMRYHISKCSDDKLKEYQEVALSDDRFVDFNEMQQIMRERQPAAEAHYSLVHDVKPAVNVNVPALTPESSVQLQEQLEELVQEGKIERNAAISVFTIAHYGGEQAYGEHLNTKDKIMDRVNALKNEGDQSLQDFNKHIVVDPEHKMIALTESAEDIAMRTIFGANNYAGMTNLNCMPIVKYHGELAELGGEIQNVNRDVKDDTKLWDKYHVKTYSFTEAYGTVDPISKMQSQQVAPDQTLQATHLNTPRPGNPPR